MKKRTRILSLLLVAILVLSLAPASAHADPPKGDTHLHSWQVISDTPPTCTAAGSKTWKCTACGETYTETYDALGHAPVELAGKPATCTEAGLTVGSKCSRCGQVMKAQESIPALGHSYGKVTVVRQPTCEAEGQSVQVCSRCQDQKVSSVPALGHDWDEGALTTAPVGFAPGIKTFTCKNDASHTRTEEVHNLAFVFLWLHGFDFSKWTTYDLTQPLTIAEQPTGGSITRYEDETVHLTCAATGGTGEYTYEWYSKKSYSLWGWNWPAWYGEQTEPGFDAETGDRTYWCVVTDSAGETAATDKVKISYKIRIDQQPDNANLQPTGKATLSCQAEDGSGSYSYVWYNAQGDTEVDTGAQVELTVPGDYYCVATDDQTGETAPSNVVTVYDTEPFRLMTFTGDGEHYSDGSGMLKAGFAGGVQPYEIWWDKDGEAIESEDAEVDDYIGAVVYNATIGNYTVHAVDAMGEVITATSHRIAPKLTIVEQPVGGTIPKGKQAVISVTVADGEAPYTYILMCNGQKQAQTEVNESSHRFSVWYPGEYYYHIEDSRGRMVDSDAVIFEDAVFRIKNQTESAAMKGDDRSTLLSVEVEGGVEPYTYTWTIRKKGKGYGFKVGDNEAVYRATEPGEYSCRIEDASGVRIRSKTITVSYAGNAPWIIEQPIAGGTLTKEVRYFNLSCKAISGTGDDNNLRYDWYRDDSLYAADTQSCPAYFAGKYHCRITDTVTGKCVYSTTAVLLDEIKDISIQVDTISSQTHKISKQVDGYVVYLSFKGGTAPYRVVIYYEYPTPDGIIEVYYSEYLLENLDARKSLLMPRMVDILIDLPSGEKGIRSMHAKYHLTIIDALGQKVVSQTIGGF